MIGQQKAYAERGIGLESFTMYNSESENIIGTSIQRRQTELCLNQQARGGVSHLSGTTTARRRRLTQTQ